MESKNNSQDFDLPTTIDNIVSELEQMEKRNGQKPTVGVSGEFSKPIRSALEDKGYMCAEFGQYNLKTNPEDLTTYNFLPTTHFP